MKNERLFTHLVSEPGHVSLHDQIRNNFTLISILSMGILFLYMVFILGVCSYSAAGHIFSLLLTPYHSLRHYGTHAENYLDFKWPWGTFGKYIQELCMYLCLCRTAVTFILISVLAKIFSFLLVTIWQSGVLFSNENSRLSDFSFLFFVCISEFNNIKLFSACSWQAGVFLFSFERKIVLAKKLLVNQLWIMFLRFCASNIIRKWSKIEKKLFTHRREKKYDNVKIFLKENNTNETF